MSDDTGLSLDELMAHLEKRCSSVIPSSEDSGIFPSTQTHSTAYMIHKELSKEIPTLSKARLS